MVINHKTEGTALTVCPAGRLDSVNSDEFLSYTQGVFTADYDRLVIDCADVDYISSKGLRVILTLYKGLQGRKLEIINTNPAVLEVFNLTGFAEPFGVK